MDLILVSCKNALSCFITYDEGPSITFRGSKGLEE